MLHAKSAAMQDLSSILFKATDTDIVIACLSLFNEIGAENIWSSTGRLKSLGLHAAEISHYFTHSMNEAQSQAFVGLGKVRV